MLTFISACFDLILGGGAQAEGRKSQCAPLFCSNPVHSTTVLSTCSVWGATLAMRMYCCRASTLWSKSSVVKMVSSLPVGHTHNMPLHYWTLHKHVFHRQYSVMLLRCPYFRIALMNTLNKVQNPRHHTCTNP